MRGCESDRSVSAGCSVLRCAGWRLPRVKVRIIVVSCLAAVMVLAGCSSSGGSSSAESAQSPGASVTGSGSPAVPVGCPLTAAAVSVALTTRVVASASVTNFSSPDAPVLCGFQTPSQDGLTVQISAFPFTTGRYKNWSLAAIKDELKASAGQSASLGGTYRITGRPEWGTDAFSVLLYDSGQPEGVEVWTPKYSAAIDGGSVQVSESVYLADATNLGDALVDASK